MKIKLFRFREDLIKPTRAYYDDAGLDCYCLDDIILEPFKITTIPLGFGIDIPNGFCASLRPRSSMNAKGILTQLGTIDSGYKGEIKAILINLTNNSIKLNKGDKVCQLVIEPIVIADFIEERDFQERKDNGFGSTDIKKSNN